MHCKNKIIHKQLEADAGASETECPSPHGDERHVGGPANDCQSVPPKKRNSGHATEPAPGGWGDSREQTGTKEAGAGESEPDQESERSLCIEEHETYDILCTLCHGEIDALQCKRVFSGGERPDAGESEKTLNTHNRMCPTCGEACHICNAIDDEAVV